MRALAISGVLLASLTGFAVAEEPAAPERLTSERIADLLVSEGASLAGEPLPDAAWLKRVSLDLVGRSPTPDELDAFLADAAPDRETRLVERLLASPEFGSNWANYWSDVVSYRVPPPELTFLNYDPFKAWLASELNAGRGWNEVVRAMISAQGKVADVPAATFVAYHQGNAPKLASETARIFLGLQLECAQCHDHPFDDWKREQYHSLVGFYARAEAKLPWNDGHQTVVKDRGKGEHEMPDASDPRKPGQVMQPVTLTGRSVELGKTDLERRAVLAEWVAADDNPWFARACVNRVFERIMGRGFCEPVDNIGLYQPQQWPQTHAALARELVAGGYDQKQIVRLLVNTPLYRRGGLRPPTEVVALKLRSDEVFDSLVVALGLPNVRPPADKPTEEIRFPPPPKSTRELFAEAFGFDPSFQSGDIVRTLRQAMLLMNNPQLRAQVDGQADTLLAQLLAAEPDNDKALDRLFRRVLARPPTDAERQIAREHLQTIGDRTAAFEDLLWSLINSAEFTTRR